MLSTKSAEFIQWKARCSRHILQFARQFADRDYDRSELQHVDREIRESHKTKIFQYMYGLRNTEPTAEEEAVVDKIETKLRSLCGSSMDFDLSCTYVFYLLKEYPPRDYFFPVFRTRNLYTGDEYFYEPLSGRTYKSWTDFEETTPLPEAWMCYSRGGAHVMTSDGVPLLRYRETPACSSGFWKICDHINLGVAVISTGLLVATVFCPPLAILGTPVTVVAATSGAYGAARGVTEMHDLVSHEVYGTALLSPIMNILLGVGGSLSAAGTLVAGRLSDLAMKIFKFASLGTNLFGMVTCVVDAVVKAIRGELTMHDCKKFVVLSLFCANIVITQSTARDLITVISREPSKLANLFNMWRNTAFEKVKSVLTVGVAEAVNLICGFDIPTFMTNVLGMPATVRMLNFISHLFRRYRARSLDIFFVWNGLQEHILRHVNDFIREVRGAFEWLSKFLSRQTVQFRRFWQCMIGGVESATAMRINREIEAPMTVARIEDNQLMERAKTAMLEYCQEFAEHIICKDGGEFVSICEFLQQVVVRNYESGMALRSLNRNSNVYSDASEDDRTELLCETIVNLRERSFEMVTEFLVSNPEGSPRSTMIHQRPLCQLSEVEIYGLDCRNEARAFDQYVYDSCVELFEDDQLPMSLLKIHPHQSELYLLVEYGDRTLAFSYRHHRQKIFGLIISTKTRPPSA